MNTCTPVDNLQQSSPCQPGETADVLHAANTPDRTSLPPEQVVGLVMLVSAINSLHPAREKTTDNREENSLTLEKMIQRMQSTPGEPVSQQKYLPVDAPVSQEFHPGHLGIDYEVEVGTPVHTRMAGMVTFAGWNQDGYGNLIVIENGRFTAWYAHLSALDVLAGCVVKPGDQIGRSGNSGNSTGPHLHYEIRLDGKPVDPNRFADQGRIFEDLS